MDDNEAMDVTSTNREPQLPEEARIVSSMEPERPPPPDEADKVSSMDPESLQNDEAKDFTSFNPELLKLPGVSPMGLNRRAEHVQRMFKQWLSLPETCKMVNSLIENALAAADPINTLTNTVNVDVATGSRKRGRSSSSSSSLPASLHDSPLNLAHNRQQELKEQCISRINQIFNNPLGGLVINEFKRVTREVCKLPSFFSSALFRKIDVDNIGVVTREALIKYWVDGNMVTMSTATQIYKIVKHPDRDYLSQVDFQPILREILATHPGLEFLRNMPEGQELYADTVLYIIFYYNDRSGRGRITLRDIKRGNLIAAMQQLDEEVDTFKIRRYFSYMHAFVIRGKHLELGLDEDLMLEAEDLKTYANNALSRKVVDRIFSEAPRKLTSGIPGKMSYQDFVYFLLAEEDKEAEASIEYWFKCLDLDENEKITADEIKYFYEEQMQRIWSIGYRPVPFEDILCRVTDMIAPEKEEYFTLRDFKRSKLSEKVFNILFNFDKFRKAESRDWAKTDRNLRRREAEVLHPEWTEWDHFVHLEFPGLVRDAQFMSAD